MLFRVLVVRVPSSAAFAIALVTLASIENISFNVSRPKFVPMVLIILAYPDFEPA